MLLAALPAGAAERGFFAGAGIGQMTTDVDDVWGSNYNFDESDTGFKIFGGYKFFEWLGVEGAYIDGGEPSVKKSYSGESESLEIGVNTLVAAAVFALPIGEKFELFIKPGWAYWDSQTTYRYSSTSTSFKVSDDDGGAAFFIGAGASFNFTENLGMRVEYEWFDVAPEWDSDEDEFVDDIDANSGFLSASFVYSF
jgi:OOP family OmpA-OmpF porin